MKTDFLTSWLIDQSARIAKQCAPVYVPSHLGVVSPVAARQLRWLRVAEARTDALAKHLCQVAYLDEALRMKGL